MNTAQIHQNTHPLVGDGWNAINFVFQWLVLPFVFVYNLGAMAAYREKVFGWPAYEAGS